MKKLNCHNKVNPETWRNYLDSGRPIHLRNEIVESNLGLVYSKCHDLKEIFNLSLDDMIQIGTMGLISAVEKYDPSKNVAFSSYAMPFIIGRIKQYVRDKQRLIKLPQHKQELITCLQNNNKTIGSLWKKCVKGNVKSDIKKIVEEWNMTLCVTLDTSSYTVNAIYSKNYCCHKGDDLPCLNEQELNADPRINIVMDKFILSKCLPV